MLRTARARAPRLPHDAGHAADEPLGQDARPGACARGRAAGSRSPRSRRPNPHPRRAAPATRAPPNTDGNHAMTAQELERLTDVAHRAFLQFHIAATTSQKLVNDLEEVRHVLLELCRIASERTGQNLDLPPPAAPLG